jgi:hypothetical protein
VNDTLHIGSPAKNLAVNGKFQVARQIPGAFVALEVELNHIVRPHFFEPETGGLHPHHLVVVAAGADMTVDGVGMTFHVENIAGTGDFNLGMHLCLPRNLQKPNISLVCQIR